jgi:hypothetical protein
VSDPVEEVVAIKLEATYSKKLGLPNYSSHSYVVSLTTELTDLTQVESESARLYALLQQSVDKELEAVGYLPDSSAQATPRPMNGHHSGNGSNGHRNGGRPSTSSQNGRNGPPVAPWACSEKQRSLILKIVEDNRLDKDHVEDMARQLFGLGVVECDKMQASQLIEELLESTGSKRNSGSRWRRPSRS